MVVNRKLKKTDFENKIKKGEKLHTIRWDSKKRWKIGNKIHFSTGVRTSKYNCFKEGICKGIQEIEIKDRDVWIDGIICTFDEVEYLSINDGFDSIEDFWSWFDQYSPFTGKIIHWTKLMY